MGQPLTIFIYWSVIGNFSISQIPKPLSFLKNQVFSRVLCLEQNYMNSLFCPRKQNRSSSDADISVGKMDFGTVFLRQQMQAVSVSVYLKTAGEQG